MDKEIVAMIALYLPAKDLTNFLSVNKGFKKAQDYSPLWEGLILRDAGLEMPGATKREYIRIWKYKYRKRMWIMLSGSMCDKTVLSMDIELGKTKEFVIGKAFQEAYDELESLTQNPGWDDEVLEINFWDTSETLVEKLDCCKKSYEQSHLSILLGRPTGFIDRGSEDIFQHTWPHLQIEPLLASVILNKFWCVNKARREV